MSDSTHHEPSTSQVLGSSRIYHLRPTTEADAHCLWEMLYHAIHVPPGAAAPEREIIYAPELARYVTGWGRPGDLGYLALDAEGLLVGAAWLRRFSADEPGYGFIDAATPDLAIAVTPAWRGHGVGSRLLEALLDKAAERYPAVSLNVQTENPALRLYRRFGFEVFEDGRTWYTMRKCF